MHSRMHVHSLCALILARHREAEGKQSELPLMPHGTEVQELPAVFSV
jgi:hypothetical protein